MILLPTTKLKGLLSQWIPYTIYEHKRVEKGVFICVHLYSKTYNITSEEAIYVLDIIVIQSVAMYSFFNSYSEILSYGGSCIHLQINRGDDEDRIIYITWENLLPSLMNEIKVADKVWIKYISYIISLLENYYALNVLYRTELNTNYLMQYNFIYKEELKEWVDSMELVKGKLESKINNLVSNYPLEFVM